MTTCPKCHAASSDAEFCSECGAAMEAAAPEPVAGSVERCPVCGEARPGPFARFCDTCRYDFMAKQPFSAEPHPAPPLVEPATATAPSAHSPAAHWDLHSAVDLALRHPEDPLPTDMRERIFPLDHADHLIGRRSDKEDIHPEIVIDDPGISRRHARIMRAADGAISLLDLGSTNGTRLDGAAVQANVPMALADGSQITIGCWTRLIVRAR